MLDLWEDSRKEGHWNPSFSRHFNNWELDIVETFFSGLLEKSIRKKENNVIWKVSKKGVFSINSFYMALEFKRLIPFPTNILESMGLIQSKFFYLGSQLKESFDIKSASEKKADSNE